MCCAASSAASLRGMGDEDRLAAAWTVACGRAMAEHGRVVGYDAGVVRIEVADAVWLQQMTRCAARWSARSRASPASGCRAIDVH